MPLRISELYGKRVISTAGGVLGEVKGVIIDLSAASVSHILLNRMDELVRSSNLRSDFLKNSIPFERVSKIGEGVVVRSAAGGTKGQHPEPDLDL